MIRSLTGTIQRLGEQELVLDVHGVGYLVYSPVLRHPLHEGKTILLHTYLAVRETALDLYGFIEPTELAMFELLLGIPKVGPKSALQILCQATPTLLTEAAHKSDGVYLHKLSGIGRKTAENIVQYLATKIDRLPAITTGSEPDLSSVQTDAIEVLISLGYDAATARQTVMNIEEEDATINSLVTKALKQIG